MLTLVRRCRLLSLVEPILLSRSAHGTNPPLLHTFERVPPVLNTTSVMSPRLSNIVLLQNPFCSRRYLITCGMSHPPPLLN